MSNENQHNEDENLKKEAPLLFGLDKKEPYEAPNGYFEKFSLNLFSNINQEKTQPWYYFLFKKIVFIPATMVLIIASVFLLNSNETESEIVAEKSTTEFSLNEIPFEILNNYVENNLLASANTDEIIDLVGVEQIPKMNVTKVTTTIHQMEEKVVEDYIMDNIDEFDLDEIY